MSSFFNYSTLAVSLERSTRTLTIAFNRPEKQNAINREMLFELETVLAWAASKVEIQSILFTSTSEIFSCGMDQEDLKTFNNQKLENFLFRLQKIVFALLHLPQTVVVDVKKGAHGIAAEFCLGADLRVAHQDAQITFPHITRGLTPCCGGVTLLQVMMGQSVARQMLMTQNNLSAEKLYSQGFLMECYPDQMCPDILANIVEQSPVARIQTKGALLQGILPQIERMLQMEQQYAKATLSVADWKEDSEYFSSPKDIRQHVKEKINVTV